MTNTRLRRDPFGPDMITIAQGLWSRRHSGGEPGFLRAMAEADTSAARALDEAGKIIRGAPRSTDALTPKASLPNRQASLIKLCQSASVISRRFRTKFACRRSIVSVKMKNLLQE